MLIENMKEGLVIIPLTASCQKARKALKDHYNKLKLAKKIMKFRTNQIMLLPGVNDIPDEAWEDVEKNID